MRFFAGCVCSAVLGSLLSFWLMNGDVRERAVAQDRAPQNRAPQNRSGPRGPGFPLGGPVPQSSPRPAAELAGLYNHDGLTSEEVVNVAVYENVNRSVVHITTKSVRSDGFFFLDVPSEGTGSGAVIDKSGHVLTNYHVIENAQEVAVTLFSGKTYDGRLVGADAINDIAVIRVDAPEEVLHPVVLGSSNDLRVGMKVFAIGNPFGLERTLTTGIISSLNRSLEIHRGRTIKSIIQIDAAINPGNSGGPLLDSHGRLIGINTAIASSTGQSSGVGFAIPVNLIARVVPQLVEHGRVMRPEIGIQRVYETDQGLLIARLTPGGPAEQAGLRGPLVERRSRGLFVIERVDRSAADIITEVDGKTAKTADDFLGYIESKRPGDTVELTVIRQGKTVHVKVVLAGGTHSGRAGGVPQ